MQTTQSLLSLGTEDVDELAARVDYSDKDFADEDLLGVCRSLLIPQPAWHLKAVVDSAASLIRENEEWFAAHYEGDDQLLDILAAMSDCLSTGKWDDRPHMVTPVTGDSNPFLGKCLSTAPLYAAVGLRHERSVGKTTFEHVLAECLGAAMSLCAGQLDVSEYRLTLTQPSDVDRLPSGHSRLEGVGRALRWLSKDAPEELIAALAGDHCAGRLYEALTLPSKELSIVYDQLGNGDEDATTKTPVGLARIEEIIRFLGQAVKGEAPNKHGGSGSGSGGGRVVQGNYQFTEGDVLLNGGRDFMDDDPETPMAIVTFEDITATAQSGHPGESITPNQIALVELNTGDNAKSIDAMYLAAKQKATLIERSNQGLPFAWGASTSAERDYYVQIAGTQIDGAHEDQIATAKALSAALAVGCPIMGLPSIRWARGDQPWRSGIEYDLSNRVWRIGGQTPAFLDETRADAAGAVITPNESIILPDYYDFHRFFDGDVDELSRRKQVFGNDLTDLKASCRRVFSPYNAMGMRLSLAKAVNVLGQALYQINQDVGPASNLLADTNLHSQTVAHYQTTTSERLLRDYRVAQVYIAKSLVTKWDRLRASGDCATTGQPANQSLWEAADHLGSKHLPALSNLQQRVSDIQSALRQDSRILTARGESPHSSSRPETDQRARYHNNFVQYVASWLMFESAMRAIIDPTPKLFDTVSRKFPVSQTGRCDTSAHGPLNLAYISDKDTGKRYLDRIAGFSDELATQLEIWDRHSSHIRRLALANTIPATSNVFYVIDDRGKQSALRPKHFQDSGFRLPYSPNAFRRLVRSYLSHEGVNGELIDAYLSHGRRGTERWGIYSTLPMPSVIDEIAPRLDRLRREIGWMVVHSPHAH